MPSVFEERTPCPLNPYVACGHVCNTFCVEGMHCELAYFISADTEKAKEWAVLDLAGTPRVFVGIEHVLEAPSFADNPGKHLYNPSLDFSIYREKYLVRFAGCPGSCPRILASQPSHASPETI